MMRLPSPKHCRACKHRGRVISSRFVPQGWMRRTHECPSCGARWTSYETVINPRNLAVRGTPPPSKVRPVR